MSEQGFVIQLTQLHELSKLRKSTKSHLYNQLRTKIKLIKDKIKSIKNKIKLIKNK